MLLFLDILLERDKNMVCGVCCDLCCCCFECFKLAVACISPKCVDKDSEVILSSGERVPLYSVQIGQFIKTWDEKTRSLVDSRVVMFADIDTESPQVFFVIRTKSTSLKVSSTHLIPTSSGFKMARGIEAQTDKLLVLNDSECREEFVESIELAECRGYMAPITHHGTFIANGVVISCYAEYNDHNQAHLAIKPIRLWSRIVDKLPRQVNKKLAIRKQESGLHWYPALLYSIWMKKILD